MRKLLLLIFSLVFVLIPLSSCSQAAPTDVTIDSSFVIVAAENAVLAAESLQTTLAYHTALDLELVTEASGNTKTITVAVNDSLSEGEYRTRITKNGLVIEAKDSLTLIMAVRNMRQRFITESALALPFTAFDCKNYSGIIDMSSAPFRVMTQNIRYADDEGGNLVVNRAPRFQKLAQEYQPDILCIQEDNRLWVPILQKFFTDNYGHSGMYSGGPVSNNGQGGNYQSIFFRTDRYKLVEEGAFWLTDTPEEATKLEGSKSIRSCTWVLLKDMLTNKELFVCNTHLDNTTNEVRMAQLNILFEQVGNYMEQYPTVFCGDFNARPDSGVYQSVTERFSDPQINAETNLSTIDVTFTRYGTDDEPRRLDYMFYNSMLDAKLYQILNDQYDGYISDHFGAFTEYSFVP